MQSEILFESQKKYFLTALFMQKMLEPRNSTENALNFAVFSTKSGGFVVLSSSINCDLYHYAGNNPVKYTDPDGREDEVVIKPYVPTEPKRQVDSASRSLIPSSNYKQNTANQNKEQKALWGEATFVDGPGENSCAMQSGLYKLSSELNNSPKNNHIYAQGQLDVLNADFSSSATDGGSGVGFSVNAIAVSGKIGYQSDKVLATIGGSAGVMAGGEVKLDIDKGVLIFDVGFIIGVRIEVNWKRNEK